MTNLDVLRKGSVEQIANLLLVNGKNDNVEIFNLLGINCDDHCPYAKTCAEICDKGGNPPCDDKEILNETFPIIVSVFLNQEYKPE